MPTLAGPVDDIFIEFPLADTQSSPYQNITEPVIPIHKPLRKKDSEIPLQPAHSPPPRIKPKEQGEQPRQATPQSEKEQGREANTTATATTKPPQETKRKNPLLLHVN